MQRANPAGIGQYGFLRPVDIGAAFAGLDVTFTVRTVLRVPFAGRLPLGGLKVHDMPAGKTGQLNVNASVRPFWELKARLNVAEPPTGIVADVDEMVLLTPWTWSTATAALCVIPSADAETEKL